MNLKKIKKAIISVSDKNNLKILLPILKKNKIQIISSGGTYYNIKKLGYKCTEISEYTNHVEMLDGRVKTLHPKIYAGILNIRNNTKHKNELKKLKISNIDLVIVNFYPFEKKLIHNNKLSDLIENIDIGGPTMVRAAAKNYNDVTVLTEPEDYTKLIYELKKNKGSTSLKFRQLMSAKAFSQTSYYESVISNFFNDVNNINFPNKKTLHGKIKDNLRYGENPHQKAAIYQTEESMNLEQLNGKKLSFNNYNDINSALLSLKNFQKNNGIAIVKHANPCGVSSLKDQNKSFKNAMRSDPISAFGGVVAINSEIKSKVAKEISKTFFEIIISRGFSKNSLNILKKKKNLRLINYKKFNFDKKINYTFLENSFLKQENDETELKINKFKCVTKKKPSLIQLKNLKFAMEVCRNVKSNAIVIANNFSTIGIGAGQPNRLDSCKIAIEKALKFSPEYLPYSVAASDAFFPFTDGVEELIKSGVQAIIQPGGSVRDKEVIKLANDKNITMVFSKTRHFKH